MFVDEDEQIAILVANKLQGHTLAYTYCELVKKAREKKVNEIIEDIHFKIKSNLEAGMYYQSYCLNVFFGKLANSIDITSAEKDIIIEKLKLDGFKLNATSENLENNRYKYTIKIYWYEIEN